MKKYHIESGIPLLCSFVFIVSLNTSCKKITPDDLMGKWISTDLVDTIEFTSEKDLYKMFSGVRDHFEYTLLDDKIKIGYNGMLYILVPPTIHNFELKGNQLTIDFRPHCYGFRSSEITFKRQ